MNIIQFEHNPLDIPESMFFNRINYMIKAAFDGKIYIHIENRLFYNRLGGTLGTMRGT